MESRVYFGDANSWLSTLSPIGARMCITSPPYYGLRDYGGEEDQIGLEESPEKYIENLVEIFSKVRDHLTDDGTLWVNIGDSYYNYRPGKGQAMPKQSVSSSLQDLPQTNPRRGNKLEGYKEKDLIGIPWMLAFALRADGWYLRQDIIWAKPNPMPESVKDRFTKSHEYIFLLSKNQNYFFDVEAVKESGKRKRNVWNIPVSRYKGAHFATYPEELIEPAILAGSKKGDIILDPFLGSGTTSAVAQRLNRHSVGIELHPEYNSLISNRISV